jgi:hypothetical protein
MRFIKSFILRLYIDPDVPELFCGTVQIPPDGEILPFKNKAALLHLLEQLNVTIPQTIIQNEESNT